MEYDKYEVYNKDGNFHNKNGPVSATKVVLQAHLQKDRNRLKKTN